MRQIIAISLLFSTIFIGAMVIAPSKAEACCSCPASVNSTESAQWDLAETGLTGTVPMINRHLTQEFINHRRWFVDTFWGAHILPAMQMMSEQFSAVAMQQVMIFGTFLDAKHQMETQRLFQKIQARAHKDYQPSVGMCEFGSGVKSLAASERIGETNAVTLSQALLDRHLGNAGNAAAGGQGKDLEARIDQYKSDFCDKADNNGNLDLLCDSGNPEQQRKNNDINYAKILDHATETKINLADGGSEGDEKDVLALAYNLYGHNVFTRPSADLLGDDDTIKPTPMQQAYLNMRSIIAKRGVAENSFNAIVGLKSEGTAGSKEFLYALLKDLGIPEIEIPKILGENPSYDTQMNILTKKIYQNPNFYTNLYDKPANVARKNVAMQAIGLMQKFDTFKSHLRSEASLSVLLELAVTDLQREAESNIGAPSGNERGIGSGGGGGGGF